jgi:hypothetical protein
VTKVKLKLKALPEAVAYATALKEANAARKAAAKAAATLFKSGAAAIFAATPRLEEFTVKGGVPAFNDGDPCVFSMYTDSPDVVLKDVTSETGDEDRRIEEAVGDLCGLIEGDDYVVAFGKGHENGFQVTAKRTRTGAKVEVDEYDPN